MVSVASLLNHESEDRQLLTPTSSTREPSECSPAPSDRPSKKPKLAKDAAIFAKSKVTGEVRYAPYQTTDSRILEHMEKLNVYPLPLSKIVDFPRHIPYNSDKKQLFQKTGRDAFEAFQYTFQPPGHERPFVVLWDYNIGLVRMTPFFKCNRYPKTVPSKMLNLNPGLREICHSITGGALVAQGYWVPYEAAKALAATFCWEFRYALVPVFGPEFPGLCARPGSDSYSTMIIDDKIIRQCTREVELFRSMQHKRNAEDNESTTSEAQESVGHKRWEKASRYHSPFQPINGPTSMTIESPVEMSYQYARTPLHTPEGSSYVSSPAMSTLNSMGTPASLHKILTLPSPREILNEGRHGMRASSPRSISSGSSESDISPKTTPRKRRYYGGVAPSYLEQEQDHDIPSNSRQISEADVQAAEVLLSLYQGVKEGDEMDSIDGYA